MRTYKRVRRSRARIAILILAAIVLLAAVTAGAVMLIKYLTKEPPQVIQAGQLPTPQEPETPPPPQPAPSNGLVIRIDPGHGGNDSGCVVGDIYESHINLDISYHLKDILEFRGYTVEMTRTEDSWLGLDDRMAAVRREGADLVISVHQNILEGDTVTHGMETWYHKGNETCLRLAELVQQSIVSATGGRDRGLCPDRSLAVLNVAKVPAVLVECGFLSCPEELEKLTDDAYQEKLAQGMADGIDAFFAEIDANVGAVTE